MLLFFRLPYAGLFDDKPCFARVKSEQLRCNARMLQLVTHHVTQCRAMVAAMDNAHFPYACRQVAQEVLKPVFGISHRKAMQVYLYNVFFFLDPHAAVPFRRATSPAFFIIANIGEKINSQRKACLIDAYRSAVL